MISIALINRPLSIFEKFFLPPFLFTLNSAILPIALFNRIKKKTSLSIGYFHHGKDIILSLKGLSRSVAMAARRLLPREKNYIKSSLPPQL